MLWSPLYVGEIARGDRTWPGLHPPIVDPALFDRVQEMPSRNVTPRRVPRSTTHRPYWPDP